MDKDQERFDQLLRMKRRPSHPGELVADLLEDNPITQEELARHLGVSRQSVNYLLSGKRSVTPDMAQRLGKCFGNGPALWLRMQQTLDLWDMLHADASAYSSVEPLGELATAMR